MNALKSEIRINSINTNGSVGDGVGVRSVVFFQGCTMHCPGCHNATTWDPCGGKTMRVEEIVESLCAVPFRDVTISGGEPLLQPEGLLDLCQALHERNFDIALYTGRQESDVPEAIWSCIDWIKTGEFRQELKTSTHPFVGSENQVFRRVIRK